MQEGAKDDVSPPEFKPSPKEMEQAEQEKGKVEALIAELGKPKDVVHKQYKYGSDFTEGVLANGCCNACAHEGEVEQGHFACSALPVALEEAEEEGLVHRTFEGNKWWVVLDSRFRDYYETDEESRAGWGEDK